MNREEIKEEEAREQHRSDWIKAEYETMGWNKEPEPIREEIREGIRQLIDGCYGARNPDYPDLIAFQPMKFLNKLIPYLHSQGVVFLADDQNLPHNPYRPVTDRERHQLPPSDDFGLEQLNRLDMCYDTYCKAQQDMLQAGFRRVIQKEEK